MFGDFGKHQDALEENIVHGRQNKYGRRGETMPPPPGMDQRLMIPAGTPQPLPPSVAQAEAQFDAGRPQREMARETKVIARQNFLERFRQAFAPRELPSGMDQRINHKMKPTPPGIQAQIESGILPEPMLETTPSLITEETMAVHEEAQHAMPQVQRLPVRQRVRARPTQAFEPMRDRGRIFGERIKEYIMGILGR